MHRLNRFLGLCLLVAICAPISVFAQNSSEVRIDRFEPLPAQGANMLGVAKSDMLPHNSPSIGVLVNYADDLLGLVDNNDEVTDRLISNQLTADVWVGLGVYDILDISFVLPVVLSQAGDDLTVLGINGQVEGTGVRDARIVPKIRLLNPDNNGMGLGFAIVPTVSIPLGQKLFNSDQDITFEPRAALDWRMDNGLQVALNGAYLWRPQRIISTYVSDDVVRWGAGLQIPLGYDPLKLIATTTGDIGLVKEQDGERANPIEALGGFQYSRNDLVFQLGGGAGLNDGVGAPDYRVFASFGYTPLASDPDEDGIKGAKDKCPRDPEDPDGFEDTDGCPDKDNDADGIADEEDDCPDLPEDIDGFEDNDGCPDDDNDGDGFKDNDDACPDEAGVEAEKGCPYRDKDADGVFDDTDQCIDEPEDKDGFQDEDGCPDIDNDGDGIFDDKDKCPDDVEDKDGFEDGDGCPDLDNDKDGIPDATDKCPTEPEVINGVEDEDGCPDKGKSKVKITRTKIEILDKVFFDSGKASIKKRSFNLLNQVSAILKANPQITKLRVEGHTDDRGDDAFNLDLSQKRAEAVKTYMEGQGVSGSILIAKGFGESKPIADNKKSSGRSENRRVEFNIAEIDNKPIGSGPAVIEKTEVIEDGEKVFPKETPKEKPSDKKVEEPAKKEPVKEEVKQ